jgi:hypothetical protein
MQKSALAVRRVRRSLAPGVGRALVETARGLLMHEIVLDGERIADYFIVAPTEWNFHPQGPLAGWLKGGVMPGIVALLRHGDARRGGARSLRALGTRSPMSADWRSG